MHSITITIFASIVCFVASIASATEVGRIILPGDDGVTEIPLVGTATPGDRLARAELEVEKARAYAHAHRKLMRLGLATELLDEMQIGFAAIRFTTHLRAEGRQGIRRMASECATTIERAHPASQVARCFALVYMTNHVDFAERTLKLRETTGDSEMLLPKDAYDLIGKAYPMLTKRERDAIKSTWARLALDAMLHQVLRESREKTPG